MRIVEASPYSLIPNSQSPTPFAIRSSPAFGVRSLAADALGLGAGARGVDRAGHAGLRAPRSAFLPAMVISVREPETSASKVLPPSTVRTI